MGLGWQTSSHLDEFCHSLQFPNLLFWSRFISTSSPTLFFFFFPEIELNFTVKSFRSNSPHSWKLRLQFSPSDKVSALTSPVTSEKPSTVLAISIHNLGKLFVLCFRPVCNTVTQLTSTAASLWPYILEQSFGQANTD